MNKKHKTGIKWIVRSAIVVLMIVVTIVGFQLYIKFTMKADILGKNPICNLPCWNNITPGETSSIEALKILEEITYIEKGSIQKNGTNAEGGCIWYWKVPSRRLQSGLWWQKGVIQEITLDSSFDLTVEEVLNWLGSPEKVEVVNGGVPEYWYWIVKIYYPQSGIEIDAFTSMYSNLIEPSTEVGVITLHAQTSMDGYISKFIPESMTETMKRSLEPWKGYGDLEKLYELNE